MVRPSYVWDYDIDETDFREILAGRKELGRLNRDWAAVRFLAIPSTQGVESLRIER